VATESLSLDDFSAGYRGVAVVHKITVRVDAGEVVALLGPNGAGKTTTLLTVSGLLPRLGGDVRVLGASQPSSGRRRSASRALALVRRGLAHVPEDRALFFGLTGREHLRLAARRGDDEAIDMALQPFPALAAIIDRRAGLMSGGEQQMLALARALAGRPKLLLIDELSLGLAPIVVEQLLPLVRRIARDTDVGVLLVEQHAHAALAVADRAYVMVRGHIRASGPAKDLAADPQRLAATYLGTD
jgi:branched-chain amino acid transport system ATP-binding protein